MRLISTLIMLTLLVSFGAQGYEWNTNTHLPISGDFNGDGRTDLLLQAQDENGQTFISFSFHNGEHRYPDYLLDSDEVGVKLSQARSRILVADVNADGFDDLLVLRNSKEKVHVLLSKTKQPKRSINWRYKVKKHYRFGLEDLEPGLKLRDYDAHLGDLNGDSRADLILQPKVSGSKAIAVLSDEDAKFGKNGTKELKFGINLAADKKILHIADFNGDHRDDILVQRIQGNDKKHHLVLIKNRINLSQPIEIDDDFLNQIWHADTTRISIADFDQNGLADLMLVREDITDLNYSGPQLAVAYLRNYGMASDTSQMPTFEPCDFAALANTQTSLPSCVVIPDEQQAAVQKSTASLGKQAQKEIVVSSKMLSTGYGAAGTIGATPDSCLLTGTQTQCTTSIDASRTDELGSKYPSYGASCLFRSTAPLTPLMCGNVISYAFTDVGMPGETFYYRLNNDPNSQILAQVTVDVNELVAPPAPANPFVAGYELYKIPPLDVNGDFHVCWAVPNDNPPSIYYEWQKRRSNEGWPATWNDVPPGNSIILSGDCIHEQVALPEQTETWQYQIRACDGPGNCTVALKNTFLSVRSASVPDLGTITFDDITETFQGAALDRDGSVTPRWPSAGGDAAYFVEFFLNSDLNNSLVSTVTSSTSTTLNIGTSNMRQLGFVKVTACPVGTTEVCGDDLAIAGREVLLTVAEDTVPGAVVDLRVIEGSLRFTNPNYDNDGDFGVQWNTPMMGVVDEYRYTVYRGAQFIDNFTTTENTFNSSFYSHPGDDQVDEINIEVSALNLAGQSQISTIQINVLPFGSGPVAAQQPSYVWSEIDNSFDRYFDLSWHYPEVVFYTASGVPRRFEIEPSLGCDGRPGVECPIIIEVDQAQLSWTASGIDNRNYLGSSYDISTCTDIDNECSEVAVVQLVGGANDHLPTPEVMVEVVDPAQGTFVLSWTHLPDLDVDYYQIEESSTSGISVYFTEDQRIQFDRADNGVYHFFVRTCERDRNKIKDECSGGFDSVDVTIDIPYAVQDVTNAGGNPTTIANTYQLHWSYPQAMFNGEITTADYFLIQYQDASGEMMGTEEVKANNYPIETVNGMPAWIHLATVSDTVDRIAIKACTYSTNNMGQNYCSPVSTDIGDFRNGVPVEVSLDQTLGETPIGGPGDLLPGVWWDENRPGTGWSFYWANDLRYPSLHEQYGETYDLLGYWFTYRRIDGIWQPVWLFSLMKLECFSQQQNGQCLEYGYQGELLYPRGAGSADGHEGAGNVMVHFGQNEVGEVDNTQASVTGVLNYEGAMNETGFELSLSYLADDNIVQGSNCSTDWDSRPHNPLDHYSGPWWRAGQTIDDNFASLHWVERSFEWIIPIFYDNAGHPVWALSDTSTLNCSPVGESATYNYFTVTRGFDPQEFPEQCPAPAQGESVDPSCFIIEGQGVNPDRFRQLGTGSRTYSSSASVAESQNLREITTSYNLNLASAFCQPDGNGNCQSNTHYRFGGLSRADTLTKGASFHDIRFFIDGQPEFVTECRVSPGGACSLELTWFTDGNFEQARMRQCLYNNGSINNCQDIGPEGEFPSLVEFEHAVTLPTGVAQQQYIFELHNNRSSGAAVIARSQILTVAESVDPKLYSAVGNADTNSLTHHRVAHDSEIGAVGGQGGVSGGSATYSIPFVIPPGRQGMQPNLGLSYSSRAGNGHVGMGWSISGTSSIHRCPKTEAQDNLSVGVTFTNTDRLCLDGQRLIKVNSEPNLPVNEKDADYWEDQSEYRTEIDSFVQVIMTNPGGSASSTGQSFAVRGKDQIKRTYDFAVLVHSGTQDQAVSWRLGEERDPANNRVTYHYVDDSSVGLGEVVLGHVRYTGSNTELGNRMVHFDYEARCVGQQGQSLCDISTSHLSGYESRQTQRLKKVTACVNVDTNAADCEAADKVREYNLTYLISDATQRLLLERVQECAYPEGGSTPVCRGGTASGGTLFTWNRDTIGFERLLLGQDHETLDDVLVNVDADELAPLLDVNQACQGSTNQDCLETRLSPRIGWRIGGDYDGDGIREVWLTRGEFVAGTPEQVTYSHKLAKINAQGIITDSFDATNLMDSLISRRGVRGTGDFDNDGRTDFLVNIGGTLAYYRWKPCLQSTPCTWDINQFEPISTGVSFVHKDLDPGYGALQPNVLVADMNVDGLLDLIVADPPEQANSGEPTIVRVYTAQPAAVPGGYQWVEHTSFSIDTFTFAVFNAGPVTYPEQLNGVTDYDGDGRPELMISSPYFRGANEMGFAWTRLVRFDADEQNQLMPVVIEIYNDENSVNTLGMARSPFSVYSQFADVNGDGLQDYVYIEQPQSSPSETPNWKVQINTGRNLSEWASDDDDYELFAPPIDTQSNIGVYGQIGTPPQGFDAARWRPRFSDSLRVGDFDNDGKAEILYPKQILIRHCVEQTITTNDGTDSVPFCAVGPQETSVGAFPFEDSPGLSSWDDSIYEYEYINFDLAEDGSISVSTSSNSNIVGKRQLEVDDLFGDGYTDTFGPIGCRSPFAICDLRDVAAGEAFVGEQTSGANPLAVRNVLINRGLLGGDANANQVDPVPQPLDTLASSHDDLDRQMFWDYKPLSFLGGNRGQEVAELPLYSVPEDRNDSYLTNANADGDHFYFASSMYVVSYMDQSNGLQANGSDLNRTYYGYSEAIYNNKGRGFQGFRTITTLQDIDGNDLRTTTQFHQFFPLAGSVERTFMHPKEHTGASTNPVFDNALTRSQNTYQCYSTSGSLVGCTKNTPSQAEGVFFPVMTDQLSETYQLDDRTKKVTQTESSGLTYDIYGNPLNQTATTTDYDPFGAPMLTSTQTMTYTYDAPNTAIWWVNRLNKTVTTNTRSYEAHALPPNGPSSQWDNPTMNQVVTQITDWNPSLRKPSCVYVVDGQSAATGCTAASLSGTAAVKTSTVFDSFGNTTSITVNATDFDQPRVTTTTYPGEGYFAATVTNAIGHIASTETDARYGLPTSVVDANLLKTRFEYDPFGLEIERYFPRNDSAGLTDLTNHYAPRSSVRVSDTNCPTIDTTKEKYCVLAIPDGAPISTSFMDQLGREVRSRTQGLRENGDATIEQAMTYNARGQEILTSLPQFLDENTPNTTLYTYDQLGRVTSKVQKRQTGLNDPVANLFTYYQYSGLLTQIWVTDGQNVPVATCAGSSTEFLDNELCVTRTYSSAGELLQTVDAHGSTTRFWGNAQGNPSLIEDVDGNLTGANYNALGHRTELFDPNMGDWSFLYNGAGELRSQTDAKNQTQTFTYDRLGRLVHRESNGAGNRKIVDEWFFDTAKKGLLDAETRATCVGCATPLISYRRDYSYDEASLPTGHNTTLSLNQTGLTDPAVNDSYQLLIDNDSYFARPLSIRYPTQGNKSLSLYQKYNINGYLIEEGETADQANSNYLRRITELTPNGQMRKEWFNNGVLAEEKNYYSATWQMRSSSLSNSMMDIHYEYDLFGNLVKQDNRPAHNNSLEEFSYDRLHRLVQSERTYGNHPSGSELVTYEYDALGNIKSKGDYGTGYTYQTTRPHAVTQVDLLSGGTANYSYDNNGNLTSTTDAAGAMSVLYDAFNKPLQIQRWGQQTDFWYGTDQQRFYQLKGGEGKVYIDKLYERIGTGEYKYYLGDWGVWTVGGNDAGLKFLHRDRLGSVMAVSDATGNYEEDSGKGYDPFGKPREEDWRTRNQPGEDLSRTDLTTRGFTQHEHLNSVDLIHMNGRTYDYNLGRFLSVDPFIQFPTNSQSLNPYSYLMNNPFLGTDPTGYMCESDIDSCFKDIDSVEVLENGNVVVNTSDGGSFQLDGVTVNFDNGVTSSPTSVTFGNPEDIGEGSGRSQISSVRVFKEYENEIELVTGIAKGVYDAFFAPTMVPAVSPQTGEPIIDPETGEQMMLPVPPIGPKGSLKKTPNIRQPSTSVAKGADDVSEVTKSATQIAREGGRHAGQLEQFMKQTPKQLQKTIGSFDKQIAKHELWIKDPTSKVKNFNELRPEHQQNLIHHWQQDIARHQELRSIAQDVLKGL